MKTAKQALKFLRKRHKWAAETYKNMDRNNPMKDYYYYMQPVLFSVITQLEMEIDKNEND